MKSLIALVIAMFASFIVLPSSAAAVLHHVHGLAFTPDGKSLIVPAHVGLAVYRNGRWSTAPGAPHDFMGFSISKDAMFSSGHPAPGSPLRNPLGLMKSTDGGRSWQQLGLSGESDFHLMTAGYDSSKAIYVLNVEPNSRMRKTGLHVTLDEGKSWKHAAGTGLSGQITSLAAHPRLPGSVAVGTTAGLHWSRDHGATFKRVGAATTVTAITFEMNGTHLLFATEAEDKLHRIALDGTAAGAYALPPLGRDFVTYIAQNPRAPAELAVATRTRNVLLSTDGGSKWRLIAREGDTAFPPDEKTARMR